MNKVKTEAEVISEIDSEEINWDDYFAITPDMPPVTGEFQIFLQVAPVSRQASKQSRDALVAEVRKITKPLNYLLAGDVTIDLYWYISGDLRYESDTAPDIENIQKPLIDGLCGPEGILIDDCQICAFGSEWVDWTRDDQKVEIRIKYHPDAWIQKPIKFIQIDKALCLPIEAWLTEEQSAALLECYFASVQTRTK